jgi:transcriptional regulator with XRE-family HTH domain
MSAGHGTGHADTHTLRFMTDYGDRLAAAVRAAGVKQERLAELAGVSQETISRIVTGDTAEPKTGTWSKIASVLGLTGDELLAGRPPKRVYDAKTRSMVDVEPPPSLPPRTVAQPPPPALTLDTSIADDMPGDDEETPLEAAISAAFDPTKYTRRDLNAAADAARTLFRWAKEGSDPSWAADFLDVARELRHGGEPTTPQMVKDLVIARRMRTPSSDATRAAKKTANEEARRLSEEFDAPSTGKRK